MTEYIDVTPTWEGLVYEMLRILPHATAEGAAEIHKQILKAARVADLYVAQMDAAQAPEDDADAMFDEGQEDEHPDLFMDPVDFAAKHDDEGQEEPNAYTLCAACQGTAHEDEGYTVKGQTVCLGCYHEHCAGLNIFNLELLRGPE